MPYDDGTGWCCDRCAARKGDYSAALQCEDQDKADEADRERAQNQKG